MRPAGRTFGCVTVVLAIIGLAIFASHAGGPEPAASAPAAAAATEIKMYLRVEGVEGECTGDLHKGCMEVLAYEQCHIWGDPHGDRGLNGQRAFKLRRLLPQMTLRRGSLQVSTTASPFSHGPACGELIGTGRPRAV